MVEQIPGYPYSSYNHYAEGKNDDIITKDPIYEELGKNAAERQQNYMDYINHDRFYEKLIDKALETCPRQT